ncbi:hypothetical protein NQ318_004349 [Aromia moschata]|uniref:Uncharacterized protein n=1 Tax=Aromia moschata TaxID=1265417 RepID=A0AAV8YRP1_9CUCU|nr:hypothetical protein NQ318_004349 [Aromia moschata]
MDDEEDVKKIMEILKSTEEDSTREFEYDEFINCDRNEFEENGIVNSDEDDYLLCDLSNTDISKLHTYDPRSSLKPEELYVIDNCSDPDLASPSP